MQVAQAADGVSAGTAARVTGAKTHQKAAYHKEEQPFERKQGAPVEQLGGHHIAQVGDAVLSQRGGQLGVEFYLLGVTQKFGSNEPTHDYPSHKKEVPGFFFPIVLEKRDIGREAGGANVPQVGGNAKTFVAQNEQSGHGKADQHPGYGPMPGLPDEFEEIGHNRMFKKSGGYTERRQNLASRRII